MIFVTVGSDRYPFNRLMQAVENAYLRHSFTNELVFQYGSCTHMPPVGRAERFMPFREVRRLVEQASIVVTHGGVGSVGLCLGSGKRPIVLARRSRLAEAIDDHQVIYAEQMARQGYIHLAHSIEDVERYLWDAVSGKLPLGVEHNFAERNRLCAFLERACTVEMV